MGMGMSVFVVVTRVGFVEAVRHAGLDETDAFVSAVEWAEAFEAVTEPLVLVKQMQGEVILNTYQVFPNGDTEFLPTDEQKFKLGID